MLLAASSVIPAWGVWCLTVSHRELILFIPAWSTCVLNRARTKVPGHATSSFGFDRDARDLQYACKFLGGSAIRDGKRYKYMYSYIIILLSQIMVFPE